MGLRKKGGEDMVAPRLVRDLREGVTKEVSVRTDPFFASKVTTAGSPSRKRKVRAFHFAARRGTSRLKKCGRAASRRLHFNNAVLTTSQSIRRLERDRRVKP